MGGSERDSGHRWSESILCHLLFVVLSVALLWPVVPHPGWWIWTPGAEHSDLAVTHWPNAHFTRRTLWQDGRFPLWRPTIMSGTPFAANPLAGLYYPLNWLLLFLPAMPLEIGFNLSALAHLWLAGAAMYALMRRGVGAGVWGALVAAVAYEASPKLLAHLGAGHVGWAQAWGWLPVAALCYLEMLKPKHDQVGRSSRARAVGWGVAAGAALAVQFCADVRMAVYTSAAAAVLVLAYIIHSPQSAVRALLLSFWSIVVFLGLAACQWIPTMVLLPETTRVSMTLGDAAVWSLPWRYLFGLLIANHGGFHEWMTYVGVSTLVLAGYGVLASWRMLERRWLVTCFVCLAVGAAWFGLGENGGTFQVLWRVVPGMGLLRVPPRSWVLVVFAVAALAGMGVEGVRRMRRVRRALLLTVGTFPPLLVVGYWLVVGKPALNMVMFGVMTPLAVTWVVLGSRIPAFPVGRSRKLGIRKPETILGGVGVLLVAIDLLIVDATLVEARSSEQVFSDGRAVAEWLAAQPGRFRIYSPSYSVPQQVAELYQLELADGVDPLQLRVYADYLVRAAGVADQGYSVTLPPYPSGTDDVRTALRDAVPDAEMLGLLGVRYVVASLPVISVEFQPVGLFDGVYVYENPRARPVRHSGDEGGILLADGRSLFEHRPWPIYVGWSVSSMTVLLLLTWLVVARSRRRRADD
jgi:hypothetical protein